jgi:hypothetical protein
LFEPVSPARIAAAQDVFAVCVPDELAGLLAQTDGIHDVYRSSLIWSLQEIIERNREFRTFPGFSELYMPFTARDDRRQIVDMRDVIDRRHTCPDTRVHSHGPRHRGQLRPTERSGRQSR